MCKLVWKHILPSNKILKNKKSEGSWIKFLVLGFVYSYLLNINYQI